MIRPIESHKLGRNADIAVSEIVGKNPPGKEAPQTLNLTLSLT